jgi:hypothetical protein
MQSSILTLEILLHIVGGEKEDFKSKKNEAYYPKETMEGREEITH